MVASISASRGHTPPTTEAPLGSRRRLDVRPTPGTSRPFQDALRTLRTTWSVHCDATPQGVSWEAWVDGELLHIGLETSFAAARSKAHQAIREAGFWL